MFSNKTISIQVFVKILQSYLFVESKPLRKHEATTICCMEIKYRSSWSALTVHHPSLLLNSRIPSPWPPTLVIIYGSSCDSVSDFSHNGCSLKIARQPQPLISGTQHLKRVTVEMSQTANMRFDAKSQRLKPTRFPKRSLDASNSSAFGSGPNRRSKSEYMLLVMFLPAMLPYSEVQKKTFDQEVTDF